MFNWNDLNSFLTLSRCSKLKLASKKLKVEPTTIARRISRLEQNLGSVLFSKSPKGYILNEKGSELLKYVDKIENEVFGINDNFLNWLKILGNSGQGRKTLHSPRLINHFLGLLCLFCRL